jgi:hypothetical protein
MGRQEKVVLVAGIAVSIGGGLTTGFAPELFPRFAAIGFAGGLGLLALGVFLTIWAVRRGDPAANSEANVPDNYNNFGNNFGHMGPINIGKSAFELTQAHIDEAVRRVPNGRPIIVRAVGNQRAWTMGERLVQALKSAGHTAVLHTVGMLSPPPDGPLTMTLEGNATCLTIAPNA